MNDLWFFDNRSNPCMLQASINCIPFPDPGSDQSNLKRLHANLETVFDMKPAKQLMRHDGNTHAKDADADELAKIPLAVPQLPAHCVVRPEILAAISGHLLNGDAKDNRVTAYVVCVF